MTTIPASPMKKHRTTALFDRKVDMTPPTPPVNVCRRPLATATGVQLNDLMISGVNKKLNISNMLEEF